MVSSRRHTVSASLPRCAALPLCGERMNNRKKTIVIISVLALAVIICIVSWALGFRNGLRAGGFSSGIAEVMSAGQLMSDQMANGSCDGVKESTIDYLTVIEKYKDVKKGVITESTYYADKMLGHVRLARIEEKQENFKERSRQLQLAKEACVQRHGVDCSEEKLILYEKRFEEKHPIACLANK